MSLLGALRSEPLGRLVILSHPNEAGRASALDQSAKSCDSFLCGISAFRRSSARSSGSLASLALFSSHSRRATAACLRACSISASRLSSGKFTRSDHDGSLTPKGRPNGGGCGLERTALYDRLPLAGKIQGILVILVQKLPERNRRITHVSRTIIELNPRLGALSNREFHLGIREFRSLMSIEFATCLKFSARYIRSNDYHCCAT